MPWRHGGPCQAPDEDNENGICGFEGECCTWYGKAGHQFCSSHRAAWYHWKQREEGGAAADGEPQRYLTQMDELLGTRYCDPTKMGSDDKFNDIKKSTLQFCVQGTFKAEGYTRGPTDVRWQSLDQLTESCSREDFERLYKQ